MVVAVGVETQISLYERRKYETKKRERENTVLRVINDMRFDLIRALLM